MPINKNHFIISLLIATVLPFFIPSSFSTGGMGKYTFGAPFSFITIYQHEQGSMWLGANLFTGNAGLSINPLNLLINVLVIYLLIQMILRIQRVKNEHAENGTT